MNCELHPEREGLLSIDLPSIGLKRYWCVECRADYDAKFPARGFGRAFGTGIGPEAEAERQDDARMRREYDWLNPDTKQRSYLA